MKNHHKFVGIAITALILTSCGGGGGGASSSQESFVSGNGSVVFMNPDKRIQAPAMSGRTLSGENYIHSVGAVTVVNVWASWC